MKQPSDPVMVSASGLRLAFVCVVCFTVTLACSYNLANAVPPCVATARRPEHVPPEADDWIASPERAARLLEDAHEAIDKGLWRRALRMIEQAITCDDETDPGIRPYYGLRASCLENLGEHEASSATELYNDAKKAERRGDFAESRRLYDEALIADPGMLWAANNLAWMGATHPDPAARDGENAIAYALYACIESDWHEWSFIDTLGAALAESGRFADAERCAERAVRLAPEPHRAEVETTIAAYRKRQPRRQQVAEASETAAIAALTRRDRVETEGVLLRVTGQDLVRIMQREGYAAKMIEEGFVSWMVEGFKTQLFVDDDGQSLQFHSSFSDVGADLAAVNEWNRRKRYSRSYLDDEGDPHLELDLDLAGGVSEARVVDFLKTCHISFTRWVAEVVSEK